MTPKERAREIARLLNAWADGKQLEVFRNGIWQEPKENPYISRSNLHTWRIKPEPRRMWTTTDNEGNSYEIRPENVDSWKAEGHIITEWQEVIK